jgi:hypothetical protein
MIGGMSGEVVRLVGTQASLDSFLCENNDVKSL